MNKWTMIGIAVAAVLVILGAVFWSNKQSGDKTSSTAPTSSSRVAEDSVSNDAEAESKVAPDTTPATSPSSKSDASISSGTASPTSNSATAAKTTTITYSSGSFSPSSVSISIGDSVQFTNSDASISVNIASDPHPSHTDFLSLNLGLLTPGKTSSAVKFDKAGTFGYHNHSNTSQTGAIVVK